MLKRRVKAVNPLVTNYGKPGKLLALCTRGHEYLTSQVFFVPSFSTARLHPAAIFTHPKLGDFNLLPLFSSTFSTKPINKAII